MNSLTLKYLVEKSKLLDADLVNEIEFGTTFALHTNGETIIPLPRGSSRWITSHRVKKHLYIEVDPRFLPAPVCFEKFLSVFVFNLQDFGVLRLESLSMPRWSKIGQCSCKPQHIPFLKGSKILGTVLKPYYHLTLTDRIRLIEKYAAHGLTVIKEDETFICDPYRLCNSVETIQNTLPPNVFYVPNITHCINDFPLVDRILAAGTRIVMVDFLLTGFRSVYQLRMRYPELSIWGHRIGFSMIERAVSMEVIGLLGLLAGLRFVHIGTPRTGTEILRRQQMLQNLRNCSGGFMPVFTKTTPTTLGPLVKAFDQDAVYMACGYFRDPKTGRLNWDRVSEWVEYARHV